MMYRDVYTTYIQASISMEIVLAIRILIKQLTLEPGSQS